MSHIGLTSHVGYATAQPEADPSDSCVATDLILPSQFFADRPLDELGSADANAGSDRINRRDRGYSATVRRVFHPAAHELTGCEDEILRCWCSAALATRASVHRNLKAKRRM